MGSRLRHARLNAPGIRRRRGGKSFHYTTPDRHRVDDATRRRVDALAIPPAWSHVWIAPHPDDHIQAVGRDARGRRQYRYHPSWTARREADKARRLVVFGRRLPAVRRRVRRDLARAGLPKAKVLAAIVRILDRHLVRVGNDEYARTNRTHGVTTLQNRHVQVGAARADVRFRGKGGAWRRFEVTDPVLVSIVRRCRALPGQRLFQFREQGRVGHVTAGDVNAYLQNATSETVTAKDFRTWAASVQCLRELRSSRPSTPARARREAAAAVRAVAARLGNTPAVCRKNYVAPRVLAEFLEGRWPPRPPATAVPGLRRDERDLLAFMEAPPRRRPATRTRLPRAFERPGRSRRSPSGGNLRGKQPTTVRNNA